MIQKIHIDVQINDFFLKKKLLAKRAFRKKERKSIFYDSPVSKK
jgi:hypothetical protein